MSPPKSSRVRVVAKAAPTVEIKDGSDAIARPAGDVEWWETLGIELDQSGERVNVRVPCSLPHFPPKPETAGGAGIFIVGATVTGGLVGDQVYAATDPPNSVLLSCSTDAATIRITVGCDGPADWYSPVVSINGIPAALTETTTKRWFLGVADVPLPNIGDNLITAEIVGGRKATATVRRVGLGPAVRAITFGPYPGAQTELKSGDTIQVTVQTDPDAVQVQIQASGATSSYYQLTATNGVATGVITIGGASGAQAIAAKAKNAFGTWGDLFTSAPLTLNQTYPSFGAFSVSYPGTQGALNTGEQATVTCAVSNADAVTYSSPHGSIPAGYAASKTFTNTATGYIASGTNYTITANRAANNATASASTLVKIATIAPSAAITIANNPSRLISSAAGIDYEIRINPSQTLAGTPSMSASIGAWQGSWANAGSYWRRNLRIVDSDPRGTGVFSALSLMGLSGIAGNSITSGSTYPVGGFAARTITFPAFSRVASIGAVVNDRTRTSVQIIGGNVLTRYDDNAQHANGYYIANADGSYNPNGSYIGLSDSAFAGANTSGTLQASVQET